MKEGTGKCLMCDAEIEHKRMVRFRCRERAKALLGKKIRGPFCSKACSDRSRRNHPDCTTREKKKFAARSA